MNKSKKTLSATTISIASCLAAIAIMAATAPTAPQAPQAPHVQQQSPTHGLEWMLLDPVKADATEAFTARLAEKKAEEDAKAAEEQARIEAEAEAKRLEELYARRPSVYWSQYDPQIAYEQYGSSTVSAAGCGLCAATVVLDCLTGMELTPPQVSADMLGFYGGDWSPYYCYAGSIHGGIAFYLEHYGISGENFGGSVDAALADFSSNPYRKMLYLSSPGPFILNGGGSYWTGGHVVAGFAVDEGGVWVHDSGVQAGGQAVHYSFDQFQELVGNYNNLWVYTLL